MALAAVVVAGACTSDHRVSPWGTSAGPPIGAFVERPDLDARLAEIEAETRELGLSMASEHRGKLGAGAGVVVVRAYRGVDPVGRPTHAVRAATARGVVMAVGPPDPLRAAGAAGRATELRTDLGPATDINGDRAPDVVLRDERGALEVWRLGAAGSTRIEIELAAPPTRAADVDEDARIDFGGVLAIPEGDPIAPVLEDVATFDGVRYTHATEPARLWHATRAAAAAATPRGAIERAWHRLLAGEPHREVLLALAREPVPAELRASARRHRATLEAVAARARRP